MMNVLVVNSVSDRSEVALWSGLVKAGVGVDVMCDPAAPEQDLLRNAGIGVSTLTISHRLDLPAARQIRRQLTGRKYDIIHATRNRDLSVSLIASRGMAMKRIAYRGTVGHLSRFDPASWLTYFNRKLDRIICNSDAVKRYMLSVGLPAEKLPRIYKGFDANWYAPASRSRLAEFAIPDDAIVVGFAGEMRPIKGVDVLIRAIDYLPDGIPVHFLLVGLVRDRKLQPLAAGSRACKRIHFTGFREDASSLMGACDIFVMPSLGREGVTRAVVEAMAQGVPAIVSEAGGLPELVIDNVCGLVTPPGEPEALAGAIVCLADDAEIRKTFGASGRERIRTNFSMNLFTEKILALYRELVTERS
jgi:glycosyltransferase involved in cell wall biosynthesis